MDWSRGLPMADILKCAIRITDDYFASSINGEKIICPKKGNEDLYKLLSFEICAMLDGYLDLARNRDIKLTNGNKPSIDSTSIREGLGVKKPIDITDESALSEEQKYLIRTYRDMYGFEPVTVRTWLAQRDKIKVNFYRVFGTWGKFMDCALNREVLASYQPEK